MFRSDARGLRLCAYGALLALAGNAQAGPINPNISVIGQPNLGWTDDAQDASRERAVIEVGETEIVLEDYLNPYARAWFTLAIGDEGVELEEGFAHVTRGLPAGLSLKAGKYRLGFGKLNPVHGHAYPFAERFRVLANYLPGEEAFNETTIQLSTRVPAPGESSFEIAVDWLRGDSFRIERADSGELDDPLSSGEDGDRSGESRPGVLGRISAFVPIDDRSGLELGFSSTSGTNNVAARARTTVWGGDAKLKYWTGPRSYLLLQTEALQLDREEVTWATGQGYVNTSTSPFGFYAYTDYVWNLRWNAGASYERYQLATDEDSSDQALGMFAGFAVLEESTLIRLGFERFLPGDDDSDAVNTLSLRLIHSMGPHKAHQF